MKQLSLYIFSVLYKSIRLFELKSHVRVIPCVCFPSFLLAALFEHEKQFAVCTYLLSSKWVLGSDGDEAGEKLRKNTKNVLSLFTLTKTNMLLAMSLWFLIRIWYIVVS